MHETVLRSDVVSKDINKLANDEIIGDIGPKTLKVYKKIIDESKTIFMNGTAGIYEEAKFSNGTLELLNIVTSSSAKTIAGGGDCIGAIDKFNMADKFTYISTGGGATLEYIINETLPAIATISDKEEVL